VLDAPALNAGSVHRLKRDDLAMCLFI